MSKAWMPFYGADFVGNTLNLTRGEIGSYVLLLWHHWEHGSLPADENQLRRIARVTVPSQWPRLWAALKPLFQSDLDSPTRIVQHRCLSELSKAAKISSKRKAAAEQMLKHKRANAEQLLTHSQSHSQLRKKDRSYNEVSCETGVKTPRHGVRSADGRFVYFKRDTDEFAAYVNDYLEGTGDEPNATADGRWFKVYGEEQQVAEKGKSNGVSSELEATVKARGWA
jgi:uncharacterized protein YdaU (DUF1376 family)